MGPTLDASVPPASVAPASPVLSCASMISAFESGPTSSAPLATRMSPLESTIAAASDRGWVNEGPGDHFSELGSKISVVADVSETPVFTPPVQSHVRRALELAFGVVAEQHNDHEQRERARRRASAPLHALFSSAATERCFRNLFVALGQRPHFVCIRVEIVGRTRCVPARERGHALTERLDRGEHEAADDGQRDACEEDDPEQRAEDLPHARPAAAFSSAWFAASAIRSSRAPSRCELRA
jgi:hypothetical protein